MVGSALFLRLNTAVTNHREMDRLYEDAALPIIGAIPSAIGLVYAVARLVEQAIGYVFKKIQSKLEPYFSQNAETKRALRQRELTSLYSGIVDYFFHAGMFATGVVTLGFSGYYLVEPETPTAGRRSGF